LASEIHILRKLDHPNIIHLHDLYYDDYHLFIVMELARGKVIDALRNPDLVLVLVLFFLFVRFLCGKKEIKDPEREPNRGFAKHLLSFFVVQIKI
jgi:serine/threonine protein kinase